MNGVTSLMLLGLFCFTLTQAYPLSPGSYTDLRFYRILGSRPFPRTSQWLPSKRSLIFPSFYNQGTKRDASVDPNSDFDPSDLAIKFGKRSSVENSNDFDPSDLAIKFGKRSAVESSNNFDPSDLAIKFGKKRSPPNGSPSASARYWVGFGKRREAPDYDSFTDHAADLAVRFG